MNGVPQYLGPKKLSLQMACYDIDVKESTQKK